MRKKHLKSWLPWLGIICLLYVWNLYWLEDKFDLETKLVMEQKWCFEGVEYTKFNLKGLIDEQFTAQRLESSRNGNYKFIEPKVRLMDKEGFIWLVSAALGYKDGETITLLQGVKVYPVAWKKGFSGDLQGDKLIFFCKQRRYLLQPINLHFFDDQGFEWWITAEKGDSQYYGDLLLKEGVKISCPAKNLTISGEDLLLKTAQRVVTTQGLLKIREHSNQIETKGGAFSLTEGILELVSKIRILYDF